MEARADACHTPCRPVRKHLSGPGNVDVVEGRGLIRHKVEGVMKGEPC